MVSPRRPARISDARDRDPSSHARSLRQTNHHEGRRRHRQEAVEQDQLKRPKQQRQSRARQLARDNGNLTRSGEPGSAIRVRPVTPSCLTR
jgi:hypothetical protein